MILRFLVGVNLLLLALGLTLALVTYGTQLYDADKWWRAAQANGFELNLCEQKHTTLLKQIRREGLWNRVGLRGMPWLQ